MKALLAILFLNLFFQPIVAEEKSNLDDDIILPVSPPQKIYSRYQRDFSYHHDRGFYLNAVFGPQWNHSLQNPDAKGIRFGGKLAVGWFVADGLALHAGLWGHFLEAASLIAGGPGLAFYFDGPNIGIDLSFGIGRAFNALKKESIANFSETVLATQLSFGKYWWLSEKSCLGASLFSGLHGVTLSKGTINTFGWNVGLGLSFLFG
jgi:hypothetical protein